jgi:lipopolysaccharide export system permease protein
VFGGILQRAILFELVRVFLLSLTGITGIFVMGTVVHEASQRGLNPAQILSAIPLIIPNTLPFTIPATTLFATCVVYGRLAADNEILAIQAAGVHLSKIVFPAVLLGLVMSLVTMGLYYHLIPFTHHMFRSSFMNDAEEYLYAILKKDRCINMPGVPYKIFVQQVHGRRLEEAIFKRRAPKGEGYDVIARALEAELHVDLPNRQVVVDMRRCTLQDENGKNQGYFKKQSWTVPLPASFGALAETRPRAMTFPQLLAHREKVQRAIEEKSAEIADLQAQYPSGAESSEMTKHIDSIKASHRQRQFDLFNVNTELHMRPALSFGCVFFVLLGCPVGIWLSRNDYLSSFISCFLPVVLLYYPLLLCATSYAKQGKVHPAPALWAANGMMVLFALPLFRRLLRH